jgi:hypothetical protein
MGQSAGKGAEGLVTKGRNKMYRVIAVYDNGKVIEGYPEPVPEDNAPSLAYVFEREYFISGFSAPASTDYLGAQADKIVSITIYE